MRSYNVFESSFQVEGSSIIDLVLLLNFLDFLQIADIPILPARKTNEKKITKYVNGENCTGHRGAQMR